VHSTEGSGVQASWIHDVTAILRHGHAILEDARRVLIDKPVKNDKSNAGLEERKTAEEVLLVLLTFCPCMRIVGDRDRNAIISCSRNSSML
jgi:hypothetical protein